MEDITEMYEAKLPPLKWVTYETQNERSRKENAGAVGEVAVSSDSDSDSDAKKVDNQTAFDNQDV